MKRIEDMQICISGDGYRHQMVMVGTGAAADLMLPTCLTRPCLHKRKTMESLRLLVDKRLEFVGCILTDHLGPSLLVSVLGTQRIEVTYYL